MRVDLFDLQTPDVRAQGSVVGADGRIYSRRGTRTKRRIADALVDRGTPLVLDQYGSGQFEWFDGQDALQVWAEVRPHLQTNEPIRKQLGRQVIWTAGVWNSDDDHQLLYLTGRC